MKYHLVIDMTVEVPAFVYTFLNRIFDSVKTVDPSLYGGEFRRIRDETLAKFNGNVICNTSCILFEFESEEHAEIFILTYS